MYLIICFYMSTISDDCSTVDIYANVFKLKPKHFFGRKNLRYYAYTGCGIMYTIAYYKVHIFFSRFHIKLELLILQQPHNRFPKKNWSKILK